MGTMRAYSGRVATARVHMAPIRVETALGKRFGKSNTSAQVVWDLNGTAEAAARHRTAMLHEVRSDTPRPPSLEVGQRARHRVDPDVL